MISSFENKWREIDVSARSLKTYLVFRVNVDSKYWTPVWYGVCNKSKMLIVYLEN